MKFFYISINTFLLFTLIAIQSLVLESADVSGSSLKYDSQKTTNKTILDLTKNSNSINDEKADNENSEDNFEELKLALIQQSLKKILNFKEIASWDLASKLELFFSSVPTSPPNFC